MRQPEPHPTGQRPGRAAPIIVGLLVIALIPLLLQRLGGSVTAIIGGTAIVAFPVWLATTYRRPADPSRIVQPYLLLIAAEMVHMGEEYLTDFPGQIRELFGAPADFDLQTFTLGLVIGMNALALVAAYGLRHGNRAANYMVWFYTLGPGLVNSAAHVYFPIAGGESYFPGLVTVILPTIFGVIVLTRLIEAGRQSRPDHHPAKQAA
jgi:hypothetical protein